MPHLHPSARRAAVALTLACSSLAAFASTSAPPWWAPFSEPALEALMQAAAPASPVAQQQLVQGYIATRAGQVRLQLAEALMRSAQAEQVLLMNAQSTPERDAMLAAVARRLQLVEENGALLASARDQQLAALATASGLAPDRLQAWVGPEQAPTLPRVGAPLPAAALAARVPEPLAVLAEQARRVEAGEAWVATRRSDWQARLQRQRLGAQDDMAALGTVQAYQQYIADTDQLAVATAQLALTWAQWLQRDGTPVLAAR